MTRGRFTDEVAAVGGLQSLQGEPADHRAPRERGHLLKRHRDHALYPHCWRCKKPVIFRATPQWFIGWMAQTTLRAAGASTQIDEVQWIPPWGVDRIHGMVEDRPDWCISRQRVWGVPITVFYCEGATRR